MRNWLKTEWLWLVAVTLLLWAAFFHIASATQGTYDTLRDAWFAAGITSGHYLPAEGPGIFQTFHLGPLWFYVVALPALFLDPLKAIVLTCTLLVALQFPLGWCLAQRVAGRTAAMIFVMLLLAPGWWYLSLPVLTHTAGVAASLMFLGLALWSVLQRMNLSRSLLLGTAIALAISAHPTNVLICGIAAMTYLIEAKRRDRLGCASGLMIPVILTFLPYVLSGGLSRDLGSIFEYAESLGSGATPRDPMALLSLLAQPFYAGSAFVFVVWGGLPIGVARFLGALPVALVSIGILTSLRSSAPGKAYRWGTWSLVVLALQVLMLWLIRPVTPVWMAFALAPLLAFGLSVFAGVWLESWASRRLRWLALFALPSVTVLPSLFLLPRLMPVDGHGYWARYAEGSANAMSVTSPVIGRERFAVPPLSLRDYWLDTALSPRCDEAQALHGELAATVNRTMGYAWLADCGASDNVLFAARQDDGEKVTHRFGISGRLFEAACAGSGHASTSIHQLDAWNFRVLSQGRGLAFGDPRNFPERTLPPDAADQSFEFSVDASRWSHLMVVNLARNYYGFPSLKAAEGSTGIQTVYSRGDVKIFHLGRPASADEPVRFHVGFSPDYVDVVVFRCSR